MDKQASFGYVPEKILAWLDEAWDEYCLGYQSEFIMGKIYGYVECLEELLRCEGVENSELLLLEEQYGIR